MNTYIKVLNLLKNQTEYLSGEKISNELGVSRTAVWKAINKLKKSGYIIDSITNKGYKLIQNALVISKLEIERGLNNATILVDVIDETTSTNDFIKNYLPLNKTVVLIAKNQTNGRGRLNRSFYCKKDCGVYLSILLRPNLDISSSVKLTTFTATVVSSVIQKLSNTPAPIKWVNDIFMGGKKVCGILTEASCNFETRKLDYAIIGIGINVLKTSFPDDIKNIATSIENASGKAINFNTLISEIVNGFTNYENELIENNYMKAYRENLFILGKEITITNGEGSFTAKAVDVTESGALIVEENGVKKTIYAGDVSIRL